MGLLDKFKENLITRFILSLDDRGAAKWPIGWVKFKRALRGWKFIVGAIVLYTPDILVFFQDEFPTLLSGAGLSDYNASVLKTVGKILMGVGVLHKWLKFLGPLEQRDAEREEKHAPVWPDIRPGVGLMEGTVAAGPPLTLLEREVFDKLVKKYILEGFLPAHANEIALGDILKERRKK